MGGGGELCFWPALGCSFLFFSPCPFVFLVGVVPLRHRLGVCERKEGEKGGSREVGEREVSV